MPKRLNTEEFLIKIKERNNPKHRNLQGVWKYTYNKVDYISSMKKVIITCKEHGDFELRPNDHLNGVGCSKCYGNKKHDNKSYIEKAKEAHNNKYGYDKTDYKKAHAKIIINCPSHGDFEQKAYVHLQGQGCYECSKLLHGYSQTDFTNRCLKNNKGLGILYVIRCFNDTEEFYKIGITSRSIKHRYCSAKSMPYNYEVISELEEDPKIIFKLEKEIHSSFDNFRHKPTIYFAGESECFNSIKDISIYIENYRRKLDYAS